MGAWIETVKLERNANQGQSHPTWVRGLKHFGWFMTMMNWQSHPTWVRGLKLADTYNYEKQSKSHPTWVRGLKHGKYALS